MFTLSHKEESVCIQYSDYTLMFCSGATANNNKWQLPYWCFSWLTVTGGKNLKICNKQLCNYNFQSVSKMTLYRDVKFSPLILPSIVQAKIKSIVVMVLNHTVQTIMNNGHTFWVVRSYVQKISYRSGSVHHVFQTIWTMYWVLYFVVKKTFPAYFSCSGSTWF